MDMKRLLATVLGMLIFISAAGAVGVLSDGAETAYAADGDLYVYVAPTDEELLANPVPQNTDIPVYDINSDAAVFYLLQSYCYKVKKSQFIADYYVLDYIGGVSTLVVKIEDVKKYAVSQLASDQLTDATPDKLLLLKDGEEVTAGGINLTADDGYSFRFLGSTGTDIAFVALKGSEMPRIGSAPMSAFNAFEIPYQTHDAARRAALIDAQKPQGDGTITPPDASSKTLRIILIIGIAVPALIIVILLFKPTGENKRGYDKRAMKHDSARKIDYDRDRNYGADRDRYERGYRDYERRDYPDDRRDYGRGDGRGYNGDRRDERGYDR